MEVDGPVEFKCWETDETFETMQFTIAKGDYGIVLFSKGCPHCEGNGHAKEEGY